MQGHACINANHIQNFVLCAKHASYKDTRHVHAGEAYTRARTHLRAKYRFLTEVLSDLLLMPNDVREVLRLFPVRSQFVLFFLHE
jgi:hypothetical protein